MTCLFRGVQKCCEWCGGASTFAHDRAWVPEGDSTHIIMVNRMVIEDRGVFLEL